MDDMVEDGEAPQGCSMAETCGKNEGQGRSQGGLIQRSGFEQMSQEHNVSHYVRTLEWCRKNFNERCMECSLKYHIKLEMRLMARCPC